MKQLPGLSDIRAAAERISPYVHRTPILTCRGIDGIVDAHLYFKCENFQKVGAFKFRGATNAVFSLSAAEISRGVATHSSGNHAAALALAARNRGAKAYVVMPRTSPQVKKDAVAGYGAEIIYCEPTLQSRESTLAEIVEKTGATFIHPYNDERIIAGAGTAGLELIEEIPDLDIVMTPVGGGGLLSGTSISVKELSPQTLVIAAEPEGADDAYRSLKEGRIIPSVNPKTIADGLLTSLGDKTFAIIRNRVDRIVKVSDNAIIAAMRLIWERMKILVEPSAAVTLGALLEKRFDHAEKRIGIIVSGGNVDLNHLPWL
ncbi:MAG: pyridoxal-phosphate dependent enzyme [candidate division Zixibacteria bacterium]|nr:pyridoxal-phosphate dependent enzyme [candidate division Zixibacteria bacterium]